MVSLSTTPSPDLNLSHSSGSILSIVGLTREVLWMMVHICSTGKMKNSTRSELVKADLNILCDPWELLRTLRKLENLLQDQMRYETAIDVLRSLVDGHRRRLGNSSDDVDIQDAIALLSISLMFQRYCVEAERFFRREVQGRSVYIHSSGVAVFGVRHLGWVLQKQNKLEEAVLLFQQVVKEIEKICGPKDLSTIDAAWILGSKLQAQGRYEETEAILNNNFDLLKELVRLKSRHTPGIIRLMVTVFISQERYTEAKMTQEHVVALSMMVFRPESSKTLDEIRVLGSTSEGRAQTEKRKRCIERHWCCTRKCLGINLRCETLTT